jgi:hypothetical protein
MNNTVTKMRRALASKAKNNSNSKKAANPMSDASNLDMRKGLLAPKKPNDMRSGQSKDPQFNRDKQMYQKDNEKIIADYIDSIRKQREEILNGSKK